MYFDEQLFDQTPEGKSEQFREGTNLKTRISLNFIQTRTFSIEV